MRRGGKAIENREPENGNLKLQIADAKSRFAEQQSGGAARRCLQGTHWGGGAVCVGGVARGM